MVRGTFTPQPMPEEIELATLPEGEGSPIERAPAPPITSPAEWVHQNLFSSWWNGLITVVAGAFAAFALWQMFEFLFVTGEWDVFRTNVRGYMVGGFPEEELWRVWAALWFVAFLSGASWGSARRPVRWTVRAAVTRTVLVVVVLAVFLYAVDTALVWGLTAATIAIVALGAIAGRIGGRALRRPLWIAWLLAFPLVVGILRLFDGVPPQHWGGLLLNIIAATVGIFVSFPIGLLLALGRRSTLPAVRAVCVAFIELFRGVPLVAWLVFGQYGLELLLPPQLDISNIIKAMIMITLFSAVYIAEIVRGGLQGVPVGQYEAARALGLSTTRMMALIVLPQALRATIPTMISHMIAVFKDTSLFAVIEFTDLLAAARRAGQSLEFSGHHKEALLPAALLFFVIAFSMSRWSQRLERRLGVGER